MQNLFSLKSVLSGLHFQKASPALAIRSIQAGQRGNSTAASAAMCSHADMAAKQSSLMSSGEEVERSKRFWMRDPHTGDWIPEDHFGQIDVAELREKLLSRK